MNIMLALNWQSTKWNGLDMTNSGVRHNAEGNMIQQFQLVKCLHPI